MTAKTDRPDEIEALLPWAATGRLKAEERAMVADALEARADLRLQMALIGEDRREAVALNQSLGSPSIAAWDRIASAVASEPRQISFWARTKRALASGGSSSLPRLAAAAAAIVIVLQGAAIVKMMPRASQPEDYQTASVASLPLNGALALVAFAPGARIDEIGAWLGEMKGVIVEGPKGGFYKIRFGDAPLDKAEFDALMGKIRANPAVKLALPAKG